MKEFSLQEAVVSPLNNWENFYVIVGSAAAALTGLMFVVITLITGMADNQVRRSNNTISAFGTPTVVHFCAALLLAASLSAPWQALWHVSLLLALCGLGGVIYIVIILRRTRQQNDYQPVLEDWLWHIIFPFLSYSALVVGAIVLPSNPVPTLFVIGSVLLLFLFIGIHNSWDTVTYITVERTQSEEESHRSDRVG